MRYDSLETITSAFISATQAETDALFNQGDVLVAAVDAGYDIRQIDNHIASQARLSRATVYTRYKTSSTFPPHKRNAELSWYMHRLCATTDKPGDWLALAADEQLSTRQLMDAIAAAGQGVEKPRYLLDKSPCTVYANHDGTYTVIPCKDGGDAWVSICYAPKSVISQMVMERV